MMDRINARKEDIDQDKEKGLKELFGHIDDCIKSKDGMKFIHQAVAKSRDFREKLNIDLQAVHDEMNQNPSLFSDLTPCPTDQMEVSLSEFGGCTSVMVYINGNDLWCANAGDSRAIIVRKDGSVEPLSYDHKPDNEQEKERIENAGMTVMMGRVIGNLALSRAIGDFE
jgi:hypothetical protein